MIIGQLSIVSPDILLLGEYTTAGAMVREYIYLDQAPLAQVNSGSPETVTYIHVDHLGTPRFGTNSAGTSVWSWTNDAFGISAPSGAATINLRMAGQYYDSESSLFYNWNRYYNPAIGRYISSDPIGLAGGLNTFGYVGQNPVFWIDPLGLIEGLSEWEEMIPIYGSVASAIYNFYCGSSGSGAINTATVVSDIFLVRSIGNALGKGVWKLGGHSWSATRNWLKNIGWLKEGQEGHHWLIPQKEGWGKKFPTWLKNQPWNIMSVSKELHQAIHYRMGLIEKFFQGTPTGFKAFLGSIGLRGLDAASGDECTCQ
ncbi:MAG: hypothetical protein JNM12_12030 [Alphaproteobacteria bacterium]|nr:hypothetical protein [Alphaproteobacteria bacterium]